MARILVLGHPDSRKAGVFAEQAQAAGVPMDTFVPGLGESPPAPVEDYDALLVLGGGINVVDAPSTPWLAAEIDLVRAAVDRGQPLLGVCLGGQLLAEATGGRVIRSPRPEVGWHPIALTPEGREDPVFGGLPDRLESYQWHSYAVEPPPGAVVLASNDVCVQGYRLGERAWGTQFHAEVTPEILGEWIADYHTDPAAAHLDKERALAELPDRLPAWMQAGRALFDGFLAVACGVGSRA